MLIQSEHQYLPLVNYYQILMFIKDYLTNTIIDDYIVFARKRQILRYTRFENSHPDLSGLLNFHPENSGRKPCPNKSGGPARLDQSGGHFDVLSATPYL